MQLEDNLRTYMEPEGSGDDNSNVCIKYWCVTLFN